EIMVTDDGRGLDLQAIRRKVQKNGGAEPGNDRELAHLIFAPGFSTSQMVTSFSGRGVGLDVVKSQVESVHGTVDFTFKAGQGTCFTMTAPLTLTTVRALLATAGGQTYAFLSSTVQGLLRVDPKDLHVVEGRENILLEGQAVPVTVLSEILGVESSAALRGKAPAVVLSAGERRAVVVVDEMIAEQEIVVKGMGPCLPRLRHFAGATVLSTGKIALLLNARSLLRSALEKSSSRGVARSFARLSSQAPKRLLIADDSVTTRILEKSILEAAGYEVAAAADGAEAWRMLQEKGADLVVSDVEMPRMDGFALVEAIRASLRFRELPVVLVTALESEKDKARGAQAGADAYLLKSAFDQKNLLSVISQLL
ncbi:MAG TPA: response regulator, partial [bacterium]|nr:response regulator [bacterium]